MSVNYSTFDGKNTGVSYGTIVDVKDPLRLGRVRIRISGVNDDKRQIPDDKLEWINTMMSNGSPSIAGSGQTHGLVVGSRVLLLNLTNDRDGAVSRIVMGSLYPGESSFPSYPPAGKGSKKKGPTMLSGVEYGAVGNKFINDIMTNGNLMKVYTSLYGKLKQFIGLIPR